MNATHFSLALCLVLAPYAHDSAHAQGPSNDFAAVPCIALGPEISHKTPPELYRLVAACATAAHYEIAVDAFAMAGFYGKYDMARVSDESAYGVLSGMKNLALSVIPPPNRAELQRLALQAFNDKTEHEALCARARKIGPPSYSPDYMVNHGIEAVVGALSATSTTATAPLRSDFAPAEAWKQSLASYFSCQ